MKYSIITLFLFLAAPVIALTPENQEKLVEAENLRETYIEFCAEKLPVEEDSYIQLEPLCDSLLDDWEEQRKGMLYAESSDIFEYYHGEFVATIKELERFN